MRKSMTSLLMILVALIGLAMSGCASEMSYNSPPPRPADQGGSMGGGGGY